MLINLTDSGTPLADASAEPPININDPDVPLAELPQTGAINIHGIVFRIGALLALAGVALRIYEIKPRKKV